MTFTEGAGGAGQCSAGLGLKSAGLGTGGSAGVGTGSFID